MNYTKQHSRKIFALGGFASAIILVAFGIASIVIGFNGRGEVRDTLRQEQIYGAADSSIPGQLVDTGSEARAQADIMRHHMLETTNGLTYAQMGRFAVPDGNPAGTNDATLAALDDNGNPVANAARNTWVTETALTTSLNTAYFAEQVGLFSIVVGFALILTGVGFGVLTFGALWHQQSVTADARERAKEGAPAGAMQVNH
jgi:F0F1-type ATP synthase membrane subunit c/vacuolar-type H+-ATPase subunit K